MAKYNDAEQRSKYGTTRSELMEKSMLEKFGGKTKKPSELPAPPSAAVKEPLTETFQKRMNREDDMGDWIKSAHESKNPPTNAEEAWKRYTAFDRSRGVEVIGKDYFVSAWESFNKPQPPQPKGAPNAESQANASQPNINRGFQEGGKVPIQIKSKTSVQKGIQEAIDWIENRYPRVFSLLNRIEIVDADESPKLPSGSKREKAPAWVKINANGEKVLGIQNFSENNVHDYVEDIAHELRHIVERRKSKYSEDELKKINEAQSELKSYREDKSELTAREFAKRVRSDFFKYKQQQEVSNAESLRSSERQPSETGQAVEASQANRGGVVEQTPPVKPQSVEQGGTKNVSGEVAALEKAWEDATYLRDAQVKGSTAWKKAESKAKTAWKKFKQAKEAAEQQPTSAEKVDVALKKLKIESGGLQAFGVVPAVWNAAVDIVRLAVKGGMAVADAVKKGLDYIRANQKEKWDEQAATDALNQAASTEGMVSDTTTQLPTQSKFFTGTYGEDTWDAAEQRAQSWLSDKTPDEALNALTLKASGNNKVVIDDDAFAQAIKLLMRTFYQQQQDAKTDFEKTDAMESLLRLAELAKSQATNAAQRLNIQKVFNENEYMVPYLVYIGAAKKSWLDKIGIKEPVGEVESFVQTSNQDAAKQVSDEVNAVAEGRTTTKTKQLFNSPEKLFRLMTKLVKAGGINWSTLFLDNSRASQEQQRKHLFEQIKNHPDLQELSEAEKIQLEQALFTAWQRARLQVMQSQLSRLIKIPRATPEGMAALAKEIYPELVRQANAGTLDTAWFRDWIANKFGLPTVRAEVAAKLFDLGQRAQAVKYQTQKNKIYQEMIRLLEDESKLNWNTIFQESWYASVLARLGTWENVTIGNVISGIYMNFAAAADRLARGDLEGSINTLALFYYSLWEGADMAQYIIRTGDLSVLPWYQERIGKMLSGDKKMRMEMLERIKRKGGFSGKTLGKLAYSKRILIALDALASVGMTDSMVYYEALSAKDKKAADLMMRRFDKNAKVQAYKQARALLGPEAPRQQVRALMHDIMREGINKEYVDFARYSAQLVAANAVPRGIFGTLYRMVANWNFWIKAPLGLAFFRATMNLMQHAYNNIPVLGATTYLQGKAGKLPANNPLHKFGIDMSTGQMRIALLEQAISLSMMLGLGIYLLSGDPDEDKEIDVEGSWDGLTPNQKKYLRETLKRYPYSIRIGDIRISYRNLPIAPMLAALGKTRDGQKYRDEQWDEKSWVDKTITAWASGIAYMKDISSIAGVAQALGFGAYDTTDRDTTTINRYAADTLGRAAGGFAPSLTKELDQILDPRRYEPDKKDVFGQWIQYFPFIRREAGKPALNTFGQEIMTRTGPLKSWITQDQQGRFYDVMGLKASQGIFPPDTGKGHVLFDPITKERRKMTDFEERLYAREFGRLKMIMLNDNLNDFLHMTNEEAKKWYEDKEWNALRLKAKTEVESRLK